MKRKTKILSLSLSILLIFSGCSNSSKESSDKENATKNNSGSSIEADFAKSESDMFTERDYKADYNEANSALIKLNGDSATCSSDAVQISENTITITDEGTFILSGTLNDGMIIVNAGENDKPQLVLDNVTINSQTSAPLYILEADKVFVTLAENSSNTLSNGGTFAVIDENNIDAAIFSKQDLTLNGSGTLSISSPVGHGIVSKDDLVITSGTYTVNSASHGLDANDSVRIVNALITIASGKDGIHAENSDDPSLGFVYIKSGTFDISSEGDGISAEAFGQIEGGNFNMISGGGSVNASHQTSSSWGNYMGGGPGGHRGPGNHENSSSSSTEEDNSASIKALKITGGLLINDGTFTIDSADDAIHSNASVIVNGGTYKIASGDDGFHADETLSISSGNIDISESYEGLEALDIEVLGGEIKLVASDDGLNAAGGTDSSGYGGQRGGDMFGGGGPGGMGGSASSNGSILISGGNLYINASGDGIDANGTLTISGGYTVVCGPTHGDTATLDYDSSATITGGTFIGTGASGMAQTFSDSEQGVIAVSVGNQSEGNAITLQDQNGTTIITHTPELSFAVVIISSPDIEKGETYTIMVGSVSGSFEAY